MSSTIDEARRAENCDMYMTGRRNLAKAVTRRWHLFNEAAIMKRARQLSPAALQSS